MMCLAEDLLFWAAQHGHAHFCRELLFFNNNHSKYTLDDKMEDGVGGMPALTCVLWISMGFSSCVVTDAQCCCLLICAPCV